MLTHGRNLPGRGAYTCKQLECFEQALARHAFRRTLRRNVIVGPELAHIYTEESDG